MAASDITAAFVAQVWFLRNGLAFTSPSSGTVSATARPDGADPIWDTWFMPNCEDFTVQTEGEEVKIMGGQQGGLVVKDVVQLSQETKITWRNNQITALVWQSLFGTDVLTAASSQGNPTEGKRIIKGWLRAQVYDESNALRGTLLFYGALKITAAEPWSGKNVARVSFEFQLIRSSLNTIGM